MRRNNITLAILAVCFILVFSGMALQTPVESLPSRAIPVLSNGGVTPVSGDPLTGNFTFYVTYSDSDGIGPTYGEIYFILDEMNYTYLSSSGTNFVNGVNFTYTLNGLESGEHYFYFLTPYHDWSNQTRYPSSGYLYFDVTGDINTPKLLNMSNTPRYPGVGQDVNFTLEYRDAGGHAPKYVQIQINGGTWTNMTVVGTDYLNGVTCYYNKTFTTTGGYYWRVRTEDTTNITAETYNYYFDVQNAAPELYDEGVDPPTGDADKTNFTFYVHYKDWEGDRPDYVRLYLYEMYGPEEWNYTSRTYYMEPVIPDPSTAQLKNGVNYTIEIELLTADYEYRFRTRSQGRTTYYPYDGPNFVLNTTGWRHRPMLYSPSITPLEGDEDTLFTISVYYKDLDNNPPKELNCSFENMDYLLTPQGTDHRNGTLCTVTTKLPFGRDNVYFWGRDSQNLETNYVYSNQTITVKGKGELGFLTDGWVTPNPGDADQWERYTFTVYYVHPFNDNRSMEAREVKVILGDQGNETIWLYNDYYSGNNTIVYEGYIYNLEAGTYDWHIEGLDYGFRSMRYPANGELTLTVFQDAPEINYGNVTPWKGNDLQKYKFSMIAWEEWDGNDTVKEVTARVVIDDVEYTMTEKTLPSNWTEELLFEYETTLSPGEHKFTFKALYDTGAYDTYPDWEQYYTIMVDGHNELLGRDVKPLGPTTDDVMNFTIVYKDTAGMEADYVRIFIDNDVYNMTAAPENVSLGKTYYHNIKLSKGNHTYWFEALGREETLRMPGIGSYYKVYVSEPNVQVLPALLSQSISPTTGTNETTFTFSVTYKHLALKPPGHVSVVIDGNTYAMTTSDTILNYSAGVAYTYSRKLTIGQHSYFFSANDTNGNDVRVPTTDVFRVTVTPSSGSLGYPPIALISHTVNGMNVTLNGSGSYDTDGTILVYYWVVGGDPYQGMTQTVQFDDPGYYSATLTVTDDDGMSGLRTVMFWIYGGGSSSGPGNDVGGYVKVNPDGSGSVVSYEDGTILTLDEVDEDGVHFSIDSNSTDPKVVILEVSKQALTLSSGEELKLRLDGTEIQLADSLDDVINGNGSTPLYYIVRTGDSYRVMVYLPNPSDIDDIDVTISESSDTDNEKKNEETDWFLLVMIIVSILLALAVILLLLTRRGPKYTGAPEYEDDDWDEEEDLDLIKGSRRETYRKLMEE